MQMTTANNIETETSFERENNKDFESVPAEDNHGESQRELILVSSSRTRSNVSLDQDGKSPASSRTVTPKVRDTPGTSSVHDRPSGSNEGQENTITSEDRVVLEDGPADGDVTHAEADSTSANRTETVLSRTQSNFSERSGISRTNGNNKNSPSANAASTTDRTEKKTRKGTMLGNVEPTKNTGKNSREKTISCTNQSAISQRSTSYLSRTSSISDVTESSPGDNIRVVVRVRPLNSAEIQRGDNSSIECPEPGVIWVNTSHGSTKPFTFNAVLVENSSQKECFEECGIKELVDKAIDGFSCTVFAFGQTGSGKTYTISGPYAGQFKILNLAPYPLSAIAQDSEKVLPEEDLYGLLERSFQYLFCELEKLDAKCVTRASFLEVYNEKEMCDSKRTKKLVLLFPNVKIDWNSRGYVMDLLNPSNAYDSLPVRWSSGKGFYVANLFMAECETDADFIAVLEDGLRNRQVGGHSLNDYSSRSHTMLTIYLDSERTDPEDNFSIVKHGKISFVDLAGSEKVKETKATGEALTESNNINKSLLTLGNCISALGDPKKRGGHIPYRDSKLTKLLADSLGGDGFTLMIACISPSSQNVQDSLNTLRYANRAKNIKNKPVVRMDPREQMIMAMRREMNLLKAENNYFRQQLGVPCSDSQITITPNQLDGLLSPNIQSGTLSPAIGADSQTFSSLQSSRPDSLTDGKSDSTDQRANTAAYAMNAHAGLYDMLQQYMMENENLREENYQLYRGRTVAEKEQEILSRENDRLLRKLDDLERVFTSSPLTGARSSHVSSPVDKDLIASAHLRRWLNSGKQRSETDIEHSPSSRHESVVLPPVRQGTYPNFVSLEVDPDVDLAAELEREHKKLKEERARKEKQEKEGKIKKEHSRKEKGNPIPNKAEDTTDVPDTRQSVTRKLRRSMSFPPAKPASDGRSSRNEDLMSVDVSHDEISSGDTQEPNYAEKELSIAAKGDTQEPNYAEKELSITAKGQKPNEKPTANGSSTEKSVPSESKPIKKPPKPKKKPKTLLPFDKGKTQNSYAAKFAVKKEIRGRNSQQKVPKQSEDKAKTEQSNSLNLSQSEFSDSRFGYHQGYPAYMYNQGIYSSEQPPPPHQDYPAGYQHMNERLRQDLQNLDGHIQREFVYKNRRPPYHGR